MPAQKYSCHACGKEFAKIFFNQGDAPKECPVCHAPEPEELGPAFEYDAESMARAMGGSCECDSFGNGCGEGCSC